MHRPRTVKRGNGGRRKRARRLALAHRRLAWILSEMREDIRRFYAEDLEVRATVSNVSSTTISGTPLTLATLLEAAKKVASLSPVPERIRMDGPTLAHFLSSPSLRRAPALLEYGAVRLDGLPVFIGSDVPPNVARVVYTDGHVEDLLLVDP